VCPYSLADPGGVQQQVLGLADAFRRAGHEVDVYAPGPVPAGVAATSVGRAVGIAVNGSIAPMAPTPNAAARTLRALARGRYDVVHVHEPVAPSITLAVTARCALAMVGTFHAAGDRTPYRWAAPALRPVARRLAARVAVSQEAARLGARSLGGRFELIGNGIDPGRFAPDGTFGDGGAARRRVVLFLGRHEPRKGLAVLLEALDHVRSDVAVEVAGTGPETARLRDRHRHDGRVVWLGRIDDAEKVTRLRSAAAVCVPSLEGESFGVVLLEAMAARVPLVASDLVAYRAVADDGRAARLVAPGDPVALAAAVDEVLIDREGAARRAAHGATFSRMFSIDAAAARYVSVFERVVVSAGARSGR